jgi:hypothetical protein
MHNKRTEKSKHTCSSSSGQWLSAALTAADMFSFTLKRTRFGFTHNINEQPE